MNKRAGLYICNEYPNESTVCIDIVNITLPDDALHAVFAEGT